MYTDATYTDAMTAQLNHHLAAALAAAERLSERDPDNPTLLRLCLYLYDATEQLEAAASPLRGREHAALLGAVAD